MVGILMAFLSSVLNNIHADSYKSENYYTTVLLQEVGERPVREAHRSGTAVQEARGGQAGLFPRPASLFLGVP